MSFMFVYKIISLLLEDLQVDIRIIMVIITYYMIWFKAFPCQQFTYNDCHTQEIRYKTLRKLVAVANIGLPTFFVPSLIPPLPIYLSERMFF